MVKKICELWHKGRTVMIKIAIVEDNTEEMQIMRSYVFYDLIYREC